jgi:O-antigen ligase
VLLGSLLVAALILPSLPAEYWERMRTIETVYEEENEDEKSMRGRLHVWAVAVDMAQANPWFGVGYSAYNRSYDAYDFSGGFYGSSRSVHSSFFGPLAELGYIGAALYLLVLLNAFHSCYRVRKLTARNPVLADLSKGAVALERGLIVFLVGGAFVPIGYNEMVWHYIGLTIVLERLATQYSTSISTKPYDLSRVYVDSKIAVQ